MNKDYIIFSDHPFHKLSLDQWYGISNLRERVFVVEQNCPYLDADGKDRGAHHIIGNGSSEKILAYARILRPEDTVVPLSKLTFLSEGEMKKLDNISEHEGNYRLMPAIGRVVVDPSIRGTGVGHELMLFTLQCSLGLYDGYSMFLSAQKPLREFYAFHGFRQSGPGYLEDDIPHIPMVRV